MVLTQNRTSQWSTGAAALIVLALFIYLLWGEQGWFDLTKERRESEALRELTEAMARKNEVMHHQVDRLKKDWDYIESIARNELGMVGKDEIVLRMNQPYRDETKVEP